MRNYSESDHGIFPPRISKSLRTVATGNNTTSTMIYGTKSLAIVHDIVAAQTMRWNRLSSLAIFFFLENSSRFSISYQNLHTRCHQPQQNLLVPSTQAIYFGHIDHLQALNTLYFI